MMPIKGRHTWVFKVCTSRLFWIFLLTETSRYFKTQFIITSIVEERNVTGIVPVHLLI